VAQSAQVRGLEVVGNGERVQTQTLQERVAAGHLGADEKDAGPVGEGRACCGGRVQRWAGVEAV